MINLPLVKFSYATDPVSCTSKFSWIHAQHNLCVVFDSFRSASDQMNMKIFQGSDVLEVLEIEKKAQDAQKAVNWAKSMGIELRFEQFPISAIIRRPIIAIRYTLPEKKIRRLQLRFTCDADFGTVLGIIDQLKIPLTRHSPKIEPSHALGSDQEKPTTILASNDLLPSRPPSSTLSNQPESTGTLANSKRGSTAMEKDIEYPGPSSSDTQTLYQTRQQLWEMPGTNLSQNEVGQRLPMNQNCSQPSTDASYLQDACRPSITPVTSSASQPHPTPTLGHGSAERVSGTREDATMSRSIGRNKDGLHLGSLSSSVMQSNPSPSFSGAYSVHDSEMDEAVLLPPRRELPFRRPSSSPKAGAEQRRDPPSPPSKSKSNAPHFRKQHVESLWMPLASQVSPEETASGISKPMPGLPSSRPPVPTYPWGVEPQNVFGSSSMATDGMGKPSSHEQPSSTVNASSDTHQDAALSAKTMSTAGRTSQTALDRVVARMSAEASCDEYQNLNGWAELSQDDRQAIASDLITAYVQTEDFIALSEDVSECWRRIVFGL